MNFNKKVIKRELRIRNLEIHNNLLNDKLNYLNQNNRIKTTWIFKMEYHSNYGKIEKINKKIIRLKHKIGVIKSCHYDYLHDYLIKTNEVYNKLNIENLVLLKTKKMILENKFTGVYLASSHSIRFKGELLDNGKIVCESVRRSNIFFNLRNGMYPRSYKGKISSIGLMGLKIEKKGFTFGGKSPSFFSGYIGENGEFIIETKDSNLDYFGCQYVKYLEGSIIFNTNFILNQFLDNKNKMIKMLDDFRKTII